MRNGKGFTLVEVLVTITVLGIVTLITLPIISTISNQLNSRKLDSYREIIESGAKIYSDSKDVDLFGYQKTGCVDIYYSTLVDSKIIEELDFSKQDINVDKIFVRIKKVNGNYSYETFLPTDDEIPTIDFNLCTNSISESGPQISFTPNGNTKFEKSSYTNVQIVDLLGISPNAKISYQWVYEDGTPIGTAVTHNFKNVVEESLTLKVDTPTGLNGNIRLVVTPVDLRNEASLISNESVQSNLFKLDNTPPNITVKLYKLENGNKTGNVLVSKTNEEVKFSEWRNHGFYIDLSESNDNNGITKEIFEWNASGNVNLVKELHSSRKKENNSLNDDTLSAAGARYQRIKMCDEASNCRSVDVIVYISTTFEVRYDANGGSGNVSTTTCYYGYDCILNNNGYSRDGHEFTGWKINGNNYGVGANVKNIASSGSVTAYAQWKSLYYTVHYNVWGSEWDSRRVKVGDNIDTGLNPQGYVGEFYQFNGWNDNPGRMPSRDVTLNANISYQMCQVCTGHAGEYRVSAFVGVFDAAGWTGSRMEDFYWNGGWFKRVVTDYNMNRWEAEDALNYVWNNTLPYGDHALNYIEMNCANGYSYYKRRP
ncbi:MAG: type II secretion system protein [Bacilli bacterium]|nr:type II secretion system protein [Bacilli bacterium]